MSSSALELEQARLFEVGFRTERSVLGTLEMLKDVTKGTCTRIEYKIMRLILSSCGPVAQIISLSYC